MTLAYKSLSFSGLVKWAWDFSASLVFGWFNENHGWENIL